MTTQLINSAISLQSDTRLGNRLFDDWYRLYDVKPTDKLYVAPEDRVKIW